MSTIQCKNCGKRIMAKEKVCHHCGHSVGSETFTMSLKKIMEADVKEEDLEDVKERVVVEQYVNSVGKSRTASFFLTLLFGPLGLFYSSVVAGIILFILAIVTLGTVVGPLFIWLLSIILGDHFTYKYNQKLKTQAEFMRG